MTFLKNKKNILRIVWNYSKKTNIYISQIGIVILSLVGAVIGIYYAFILKEFINEGTPTSLFGLVILIGIIFAIVTGITIYSLDILKKIVHVKMIVMSYKSLVLAKLDDYKQNTPGDFLAKIISDTQMAGAVIGVMWPVILVNIIRFTGYLLALFVLNIYLPFLILIFVPTFVIIYLRQARALMTASLTEREGYSGIVESLRTKIEAIPSIKSMVLEKQVTDNLESESYQWYLKNREVILKARMYASVYSILSTIIPLVILFILMKTSILDLGVIAVFFYLAGSIMEPLVVLTSDIGSLSQMFPSINRIIGILELPKELEGNKKLKKVSKISIDASHNNFNYKIKIKKGDHIGIVGPTGCGKTTFARILNRLYYPKGEYRINGLAVSKYNLKSLRNKIILISGEEPIFRGTVKKNLMGPIIREIIDIPLDEIIGPGARELSLGERQRVCLIRALNKKPEVLILDEALSGIDPELEIQIISILKERIPILIIISHRISIIKQMDKIIMLSDGIIKYEFDWTDVPSDFLSLMKIHNINVE